MAYSLVVYLPHYDTEVRERYWFDGEPSELQIKRAIADFKEKFGRRTDGKWKRKWNTMRTARRVTNVSMMRTINQMRSQGYIWDTIGYFFDVNTSTIKGRYYRWRKR